MKNITLFPSILILHVLQNLYGIFELFDQTLYFILLPLFPQTHIFLSQTQPY